MFLLTSALLQSQETPDPLIEKEHNLRANLDSLTANYESAKAQLENLEGEDRKILEKEAHEIMMAELDNVYELAEVVVAKKEAELDTTELSTYVEGLMTKVPEVINWSLQHYREDIEKLQSEKETATGSEQAILTEEIASLEAGADRVYEIYVAHIQEREKLGIDATDNSEAVKTELSLRARLMAGRLKKHIAERKVLQKRISATPDDKELTLRLAASQIAIDSETSSVERLVNLMEPLELPVSSYRALLIQTTSDLSRGLETGALTELARQGWEYLVNWIKDSLPKTLTKGFILLLIIYCFWLLSKVVKSLVGLYIHLDYIFLIY